MPDVSNPLVGAKAVASGEVIYQTRLVVPSDGSVVFAAGVNPELRARLSTLNLPTLQWYLFLDPLYILPSTGVQYNAQLNMRWRPVVQIGRAVSSSATAMSLPFSAPAILPVATPVRVNVRAPVIDIGIEIDAPAQQPLTYSSIQLLLCASQ